MNKIIFYIKQLFPFTYWSKYKTPDDQQYIAIWRQWFGKVINPCHFNVVD